MKLALGMMIHHEEAWLKLHLPVIADCFDFIVVVCEPGDEGIPFFSNQNVPTHIYEHPFNNNWSEMYNRVIQHAEDLGCDAIVRLDPDELLFPEDISAIRQLLTEYKILCFARYNFWADRLHYTPGIYPDWQARAWVLNQGIHLGGQHHEGINWLELKMYEGDAFADTPRQVLRVPTINIYHYGNVGRERMLERDLHYVNVDREKAGHPPLTELPKGREFPTRHSIIFHGRQPIDPETVGIYAPYKE